MYAMIIRKTGGPEVFEYAEIATPEPGPGEVLVEVAYAGVNPADWKNRQGMLASYRPYVFPYVIGFDAAGLVAGIGAGVEGFEVSDRVFTPTSHGQGAQGSYAQYTLASADRVAHIPPGLGFDAAAALPVASLTAWQGLFERGGLRAGERVLIHGGSGGVGSFAVQFARWAGARVAATCSAGNIEYLHSLGVEEVIDYNAQDIASAVADWTPEGLDYLMDAVGASTLRNALDLVKAGGSYVSIPTLVDDGELSASLKAASSKGVRRVFSTMEDANCAEALEKIATLLVEGAIQLPPLQVYPLVEVAAVHKNVQLGHTRGKCVLKVAELG